VKYLSIVILLLSALPLSGQITAPGASAVRTTEYPGGYTPNDPVFIFCSNGATTGSLNAVSPGGTAPFNFEWYRWNTADNGFTIFIKTDAGVGSSLASGLDEGGYRVRVTDGGGYETFLIAWVHLARPTAQASLRHYTCYYVALQGIASADTFYYYQPNTGQSTRLPVSRSYLWSSDPPSAIPNDPPSLEPVTYKPPLENVTYKLVVTDSFGCTAESSFFYESIHVKADFSAEPDEGEAPLEVYFTDNSVRASTYEWRFGDDSLSRQAGSVTHTYYKPGVYTVSLVIESSLNCVDSMQLNYVTVKPSALSIPNVFTPDGDGINEFFKPDIASLRFIDVQVFSRSGMMVYSFRGEGERLREWQGWDGSVNNSSVKASPGLYYYVIRAIGWDNVIYDTKENRGVLYLYR